MQVNQVIQRFSPGWQQAIGPEFNSPYIQALSEFVSESRQAGKVIYPPSHLVFNALETTPLETLKVVILGQDPYHGEGQAHGLSFSVPEGVKLPPSLLNIYKELKTDLNIDNGRNGYLQPWAEQGVLLLNSVLTVEQNQAASHQGKGWESFTDRVIEAVNQYAENVVFLLWGSYAQKKGRCIDETKHLVLKSVHPSPLSAHRGFFGCQHFSKANAYLQQHGKAPVNWQL